MAGLPDLEPCDPPSTSTLEVFVPLSAHDVACQDIYGWIHATRLGVDDAPRTSAVLSSRHLTKPKVIVLIARDWLKKVEFTLRQSLLTLFSFLLLSKNASPWCNARIQSLQVTSPCPSIWSERRRTRVGTGATSSGSHSGPFHIPERQTPCQASDR